MILSHLFPAIYLDSCLLAHSSPALFDQLPSAAPRQRPQYELPIAGRQQISIPAYVMALCCSDSLYVVCTLYTKAKVCVGGKSLDFQTLLRYRIGIYLK